MQFLTVSRTRLKQPNAVQEPLGFVSKFLKYFFILDRDAENPGGTCSASAEATGPLRVGIHSASWGHDMTTNFHIKFVLVSTHRPAGNMQSLCVGLLRFLFLP